MPTEPGQRPLLATTERGRLFPSEDEDTVEVRSRDDVPGAASQRKRCEGGTMGDMVDDQFYDFIWEVPGRSV